MGVRTHIRHHGAIHAIWLIGILLLVIAWLLLGTPNGDVIGEYIGFAASVASLVLAVVAIGYSFISNQGLTETVSALRNSSTNISQAAENIAATSAVLVSRAEELTGQVARVPTAVEALSARLDEKIFRAAEASSPAQLELDPSDTSAVFSRTRLGGQLALYVLTKSFTENKPFDAGNIFEDRNKNRVWDSIILGATLLAHGLKPCGIVIDVWHDGSIHLTQVKSMGSLDPELIMRSFTPTKDDSMRELRDQVDAYFSRTTDAAPPPKQ